MDISNGVLMLADYYSLQVPDVLIIKILENDEELKMEVETNGIRDTCQRSILVDAVLKEIGMRDWPCNGEGDEVFNKFIKELTVKLKECGGCWLDED